MTITYACWIIWGRFLYQCLVELFQKKKLSIADTPVTQTRKGRHDETWDLRVYWVTCLTLHLYQIWWLWSRKKPSTAKLITSLNSISCARLMRQNLHNRTRPRSTENKYPCHVWKWHDVMLPYYRTCLQTPGDIGGHFERSHLISKLPQNREYLKMINMFIIYDQ